MPKAVFVSSSSPFILHYLSHIVNESTYNCTRPRDYLLPYSGSCRHRKLRVYKDRCSKFGVSRSTLFNGILGVQTSHTQFHEHTQVLSPSEETCSVDYIRRMSQAGHSPPPRIVRETAQHIITRASLTALLQPALPSHHTS
jgi:hypothetical protein